MPLRLYEFMAQTYGNRPFIIGDGLLPQQTKAVMFGPQKKGKSILASQLLLAVVDGLDWLGFQTNTSQVLYIQFEIPEAELQKRFAKMLGSGACANPSLVWLETRLSGMKLDRQGGMMDLENMIVAAQPMLLILDPLYKLMSTDSAEDGQKFRDFLDTMISKYGLSIMILAHKRKQKTTTAGETIDLGSQELLGSVLTPAWVDTIINLAPTGPDKVRLAFECRHSNRLLLPIDLELDRSMLRFKRLTP